MRSRNTVAAQVVVYVNGRLFGVATSVGWNVSTPMQGVACIDMLDDAELADGRVGIRGEISALRRINSAGFEQYGIVPIQEQLPNGRYFTLELRDRRTLRPLLKAVRCRCTEQKWAVKARSRVEGSFSFMGLDWSNESADHQMVFGETNSAPSSNLSDSFNSAAAIVVNLR